MGFRVELTYLAAGDNILGYSKKGRKININIEYNMASLDTIWVRGNVLSKIATWYGFAHTTLTKNLEC